MNFAFFGREQEGKGARFRRAGNHCGVKSAEGMMRRRGGSRQTSSREIRRAFEIAIWRPQSTGPRRATTPILVDLMREFYAESCYPLERNDGTLPYAGKVTLRLFDQEGKAIFERTVDFSDDAIKPESGGPFNIDTPVEAPRFELEHKDGKIKGGTGKFIERL